MGSRYVIERKCSTGPEKWFELWRVYCIIKNIINIVMIILVNKHYNIVYIYMIEVSFFFF